MSKKNIILLNEFSQASKNKLIVKELEKVANRANYEVYNLGMRDENDHYLTYINLGIISSILINGGMADFIITGCGTGQGALMALNSFPGVTCGYCIEPTDAFLFAQINNGNALSIPFAKGFGWGAELNLENIFEKILMCERGNGYPTERKKAQNKNVEILSQVKEDISKDFITGLKSIDEELLKISIGSKHFQDFFFNNCKNEELLKFIEELV